MGNQKSHLSAFGRVGLVLFLFLAAPKIWAQGGGADSGQAANQNTGNNPGNAHAECYGTGGNAPTGGSGNTVGSSGPTNSSGSSGTNSSSGSNTNSSSGAPGGTNSSSSNGSTNSDGNRGDRPCCSFGGNIGGSTGTTNNATQVISGGSRLSFPSAITTNPKSHGTPSDLSMGTVVTGVQGGLKSTSTGSLANPTGNNGGFDRDGNFYSLGTQVPPAKIPARSVLDTLIGALQNVPVPEVIKAVTGNLVQVGAKTVNSVGRAVQPHAQTLVSAVTRSVTAGQNTLAELARPDIRNALGITGSSEGSDFVKATAMKSELRAFYSGIHEKYRELNIPEDKRWFAEGPVSQASRYSQADLSPQQVELSKAIDERFRLGRLSVLVPDSLAIKTPNYVTIDTALNLRVDTSLMTDTQILGAMTSITVLARPDVLDRILDKSGIAPDLSFLDCVNCSQDVIDGLNIHHPSIQGGLNLIPLRKDADGQPIDMSSTLTHEWTHSGDRAVLADLDAKFSDPQTSESEKVRLQERYVTARAAWFGNFDEVNKFLKSVVKDDYLSDPLELRAFSTELDELYDESLADRLQITNYEAKVLQKELLNDPVIQEMNRNLDEHATEMLGALK